MPLRRRKSLTTPSHTLTRGGGRRDQGLIYKKKRANEGPRPARGYVNKRRGEEKLEAELGMTQKEKNRLQGQWR